MAKYSIIIDQELKIIRYTHSGLILAEDIEEAWSDLLKIEEFTQLKYNLLSDYSEGVFQIHPSALPYIIEFMHSVEYIVRGKKQALMVNDPYSVAASIIFLERVGKEIGFKVQVFSTETHALGWLLSNPR